MATDKEKRNWLRTQVRGAAFIATGFSVAVFCSFVYLYLREWDWKSYAAFALGAAIGILFGTRRPINPLRMTPIIRQEPVKMTEEQALTHLRPYWEQFPRYYCWIANIPYLIAPLIMTTLTHGAINNLVLSLKYALVGFFSSVTLCPAVFYAYVVHTWREEGGDQDLQGQP